MSIFHVVEFETRSKKWIKELYAGIEICHTLYYFKRYSMKRKICRYRATQKNENFWKTQQKLNKSKKKKLLTEIEPLQLAF